MNNIAREPTQTKWQAGAEVKQGANRHDAYSNNQEQSAKFAEGVHRKSLRAEAAESQRRAEKGRGGSSSLDQFVSGEEISDLKSRSVGGIGAVSAIVADAGA